MTRTPGHNGRNMRATATGIVETAVDVRDGRVVMTVRRGYVYARQNQKGRKLGTVEWLRPGKVVFWLAEERDWGQAAMDLFDMVAPIALSRPAEKIWYWPGLSRWTDNHAEVLAATGMLVRFAAAELEFTVMEAGFVEENGQLGLFDV